MFLFKIINNYNQIPIKYFIFYIFNYFVEKITLESYNIKKPTLGA